MASAATVKMMTTDMGVDAMRAINRKWVNDTRKEMPPIYTNYMRKVNTDEYFLEYWEMGGFGEIPLKDEGDYLNFATPDVGEMARIQPEVRQLAFAITKEDRRFNRLNKVGRATKMLARAARRTVERIAAYPLNVAFSSTIRKTTDGQALVSATHTMINGTVVSNSGTASDLTIAALEAGLVAWTLMVDNDGSYISIKPKFLVVHPAQAPNARRVLRSTNWWAATSDTDTTPSAVGDRGIPNATIQDAGLILVVNPYLTDPDAWFLLAAKDEHELIMVENEKFNDRSFVDPYTQDYVYSVEFADIAGAPNFVGIWGNTGAPI